MPGFTMKYPHSSVAWKLREVRDPEMAVYVMEARNDREDLELWDGDYKLCSIEPCSDGVWRVSK